MSSTGIQKELAKGLARCSLAAPGCSISGQRVGRVHSRNIRPARSTRLPVHMRMDGGVIDRPTISKPDSDRKTGSARKRPPIYRVLLHNDNFNKREYVVQVLMKVVEGLTVDDAVNVMQEAHMNGLSLVTACAQEEAERYCQGLRNNGLTSTVEPDGGPVGGGGGGPGTNGSE